MKPVKDELLTAVEDQILRRLHHIDEFCDYEGTDVRYYHKAKVIAGEIQGLAKLRQGETARLGVVLSARRHQAAVLEAKAEKAE